MYGSYSRFIHQQAAESINRARIEKSQAIAQAIKTNGGRLTIEKLQANFSPEAIECAIEFDRTIHPVSIDTDKGVVTYYEAN